MSDATASPASPQDDERLAYRGVFQRMLIRPEIGAAIGAIAIWTFFWAVSVPFGKAGGAASILDVAASPLGIMAVAVAMLMIGGEFDLSTGAATGAFGIVLVLMVRDVMQSSGGWTQSLWWALILSLLAALFLGWFNGTVVDRTGLPSFIVTLSSFFVLRGAKLGYSKQLVEQIQVGRLDELLLQADRERLIGLRAIDNAEGAQQQQFLDSLGVTMETPVEGLDVGNGTFGALLDAVRSATERDNQRELEELAELSRAFIDRSDRGYSTLNDIFAAEWIRNEHIWEWRDWGYTIGAIAGISLLVLALYEMHFSRRESVRTAGVLPMLGGLAITAFGAYLAVLALVTRRSENLVVVGIVAVCALAIVGAGVAISQRYLDRTGGTGMADTLESIGRNLALIPGVIIALFGVRGLHTTDSVRGNTVGSVIIFAGMLVGLLAWGYLRYELRATGAQDTVAVDADLGTATGPLVAGVVAATVGIGLAAAMDSTNSTDLIEQWQLNGWHMFAIALVTAAIAGGLAASRSGAIFAALNKGDTMVSRVLASFFGAPGQTARTVAMLTFVITMLFLDQATVQGARAIFFLLALGVSIGSLLLAVRRVRRRNHERGALLLFLLAGALGGLAFFVRSESMSPKFRAQMFSVLLLVAAMMAIWAIASMLFRERRQLDPAADGLGRALAVAGGLLISFGLAVRLLAVTQAEIDAGINQTKFSVRIIWFLAFTAVATWVLGRTRFGSWTFAVGGNKDAARQVGVPASRTKTQLFMLTAAAAWLVGVLLSFRLNTIQASTGDGEEFEYIIAAVVGGNALTGGRGSTLGAAIGAVIMAMSVQGIPSARWNSDWRFVFVGVILLLAVIANNYIRVQAEQAR